MKHFFGVFILIVSFFGVIGGDALAQTAAFDIDDATHSFKKYKDVTNLSILVPTVIEVSFENDFLERFDFAVYDMTTENLQPSLFKQTSTVDEIPIFVGVNTGENTAPMIDKKVTTYTEFLLPDHTQGETHLTISSTQPITSSSLTLLLDAFVALPTLIEIRAHTISGNVIVLAKQKMGQQTIFFPKTTSTTWTVSLTYAQPLRITELQLHQENNAKKNMRGLRFLAQPQHAYRIYFDSDTYTAPIVGESGNLNLDEGVVRISDGVSMSNLSYTIADGDTDQIPDIYDNCVSVANTDQVDIDGNGRGDVCDDFDRDGFINSKDNCPNEPNRNQRDSDADGIGDVCDGQESRLTEKYPWLPWIGMGFAAIVLIMLFFITARSTKFTETHSE